MIDDCKPTHFFTNRLSARAYKFIACKLHNSLFVSFPKRKLRERYRTAVQYVARFCVLPRDLSFVLTNFLWLNKKPPFVQANYRSIRHEISCELSRELSSKNHGNKERNSHISLALLLHSTVPRNENRLQKCPTFRGFSKCKNLQSLGPK